MGSKVWEVSKGKVTISNPNSYVYSMAFKISCEPCSSKTNTCWFDWKKSLRIDLLKKWNEFLQ
jgi:hypothetical protein